MRTSEIRRCLAQLSGTITVGLDAMQSRGLIIRQQDASDLRVCLPYFSDGERESFAERPCPGSRGFNRSFVRRIVSERILEDPGSSWSVTAIVDGRKNLAHWSEFQAVKTDRIVTPELALIRLVDSVHHLLKDRDPAAEANGLNGDRPIPPNKMRSNPNASMATSI